MQFIKVAKEIASFAFWVLLTLVVATRFIGTAEVVGDSMLPTYKDGDLVFVLKTSFKPSYEDVLVVDCGDRCLIKRVIATGGSTVNIANGKVYVDGNVLNEPYITEPTFEDTVEMPVKVSEDSLFLLGDNRTNSKDSRSSAIGLVSEKDVVGKVLFTIKRGK